MSAAQRIRQRLVRATLSGRDAHGAVAWDDKPVWQAGYDAAREQLLSALAALSDDELRALVADTP